MGVPGSGRRPKPTALKLLQGKPGHRPINRKEPRPYIEAPDPPDFLDAVALKEWHRVAPELERLGVLSRIDRAALAAYCFHFSCFTQAADNIKLHGITDFSKDGIRVSAYFKVMSEAGKQMKSFLTEFGMTPSGRSRLAVEPKEEADPLEAFLQRGSTARQ